MPWKVFMKCMLAYKNVNVGKDTMNLSFADSITDVRVWSFPSPLTLYLLRSTAPSKVGLDHHIYLHLFFPLEKATEAELICNI